MAKSVSKVSTEKLPRASSLRLMSRIMSQIFNYDIGNDSRRLYMVNTILGEIQNILIIMRSNSRFSSSSLRENPLIRDFKRLKSQITPEIDIKSMDPLTYFNPFLNVIHSDETSGTITGAALSSVQKFIEYGFILENTPEAAKSITKIAETVSHCRFEATSPESDDIVVMKVLRLLYSIISSPVGFLLPDDTIWKMIQTCFRFGIHPRLSELLRKTAEQTIQEIVFVLFKINNHSVCQKQNSSNIDEPDLSMLSNNSNSNVSSPPRSLSDSNPSFWRSEYEDDYVNPRGIRFRSVKSDADSSEEVYAKPYGTSCIIKIFQFLCNLINPLENADSYRLMELNLLNSIFEIRSPFIEQIPQLVAITTNDLCKYLLQSLHTDNLEKFHLILRLFYNLYNSFRRYLKPQLEIFFSSIVDILSNSSISFEKHEIILEMLILFYKKPTFILDIYSNYDCFPTCRNIFENLSKFLYKNSFPVNGVLYSYQLYSIETLLAAIDTILKRTKNDVFEKQNASLIDPKYSNPGEFFREQRLYKIQLSEAAEIFNNDPKKGIKFLQDKNLLSNENSPSYPDEVSKFLRMAPGINCDVVGGFLSKPSSAVILNSIVKTFNFSSLSFIHAIRLLLSSLKVSGDAQVYERTLEYFSHHWTEQNPNAGMSQSVAYVLVYSIILLNVDAHNDRVRNKMSQEEYLRSVSGIKDNKENFPAEFLIEIYKNITKKEIKFAEENLSGEITDEQWQKLLQRSSFMGEFLQVNNRTLDVDIFNMICKSLISALAAVFDTANNQSIILSVLHGFKSCSLIAAYYSLTHCFDFIVITLSKFTTLLNNYPQKKRLAAFGVNKKAQIATSTLFEIILQNGDHLRDGWKNVLKCIITLYEMEVVNNLIDDKDILENGGKRLVKKDKKETSSSSSMLSIFGGWFSSTDSSKEETTPEDLEAENNAKLCISKCKVKELFDNSKNLQADSLACMIEALKAPFTHSLKGSSGNLVNNNVSINSNLDADEQDQSNSCFCLELLTNITLANEHRISFVWTLVSEHYTKIIQCAAIPSPLIERAIVCLLLLCVKLIHHVEISSRVLSSLEIFLSLDVKVLDAMSESILIAITKLIEKSNSKIISDINGWPVILSLIEKCSQSSTILSFEKSFSALKSISFYHNNSSNNSNNNLSISNNMEPSHPLKHLSTIYPSVKAIISFITNFPKQVATLSSNNQRSSIPLLLLSSPSQLEISQIPLRALEILYSLFENLLTIDELAKDIQSSIFHSTTLWKDYWLTILQCYVIICKDIRFEVRNHAMTLLQRLLLSPHLQLLSPRGLQLCFEMIVFPLLTDLLNPFSLDNSQMIINLQTLLTFNNNDINNANINYVQSLASQNNNNNMIYPNIRSMSSNNNIQINGNLLGSISTSIEETRVRAMTFLSKVFLQYLPQLTQLPDFHTNLWLQILNFIKLYTKADQSGLLKEAVPEAAKNILLVMLSSNIFHQNLVIDGQNIWNETWSVINAICPTLIYDEYFRESLGLGPLPNDKQLNLKNDASHSSPSVLPPHLSVQRTNSQPSISDNGLKNI